jgi:hypothetical protein
MSQTKAQLLDSAYESGAILTGSTNNTITTVTGAKAIQGEANLTYDGTDLKITTDANGEGIVMYSSGSTFSKLSGDANRASENQSCLNIQANWDGTAVGAIDFVAGPDTTNKDDGHIRFQTATSGSSLAERLRLDSSGRFLKGLTSSAASRNSTSTRNPHFQLSSPWSSGLGSASIECTDDYPIIFINSNATYQDNAGAGVVTFSVKDGAGNYCNTAEIKSQIDGTPGNNDSPGELTFWTTSDGACATTERMKIDSSGRVTTPSQPCSMYASLSNSSTNGATDSTETLVFHNAKRDEGSHYNNSNGRFTAPVAGTYFVGHNCLIDNNASDIARAADLQKNGSNYVTLWYDQSGGDNDYHGVSGTAIIELAANDYISIRATAGIHDGAETNFFAYLLG